MFYSRIDGIILFSLTEYYFESYFIAKNTQELGVQIIHDYQSLNNKNNNNKFDSIVIYIIILITTQMYLFIKPRLTFYS